MYTSGMDHTRSTMRGGRGYSSRGQGSGRGTNYRSSNNYNSNYNSSAGGGGSRYHQMGNRYHSNNYQGPSGGGAAGGGAGGNSHYDSRNRDKFNNSSSSIGSRHDSVHKRTYRENSRDRSDDRKRPRPEDYRRTSSAGRGNRTPPPPPPPMTTSSSNYRGGNTAGSTYRGVGRGSDRDETLNRHRSPMGPPKRPPLRTGYIPRARGSMSTSTRGIRPTIRGGGRGALMRRESHDLRIMRRKLIYAQQKDRARLLKIARLTRLVRRSKSPRRSRSDKKGGSSDEEIDDDDDDDVDIALSIGKDDDDDEELEKSDTDSKKKLPAKRTTAATSKRPKSSEKDDDEGDRSANDHDANTDEDGCAIGAGTGPAVGAIKLKPDPGTPIRVKKDSEAAPDTTGSNGGDDSANPKNKDKDDAATAVKKEGKTGKKDSVDGDEEPRKEKIAVRKALKKDEKEASTSAKKLKKKDDTSDAEYEKKEKVRLTRRDDHHIPARKTTRFIKLTCIHCNVKCVTFKEYSQHLYSRQHKSAIRQIALRQKAHLLRLRARQRAAQREIEENSKEEYESKFCYLCRLHYRQPKAKHQLSEHHKTMKKFLMPYCSTCHLAFKNPMLYETHRCSLDHIRNKARKHDSDSDNSGDDMREIDLNKFLTVDSVGEIDELDEDIDASEEALINDSEAVHGTDEDELKKRQPIGGQFVKRLDTFYCELCEQYTPANGTLDAFLTKHCKQRVHLKAFIRLKETATAEKSSKEKNTNEGDTADHDVSGKQAADADKENTSVKAAAGDPDETVNENEDADVSGEDKLWEDVDKDLGDLLREVDENQTAEEEEEEDESVLNIDIESEKPKNKELNGKKDEPEPAIPAANKPKPQRKSVTATRAAAVVVTSAEAKEKATTAAAAK